MRCVSSTELGADQKTLMMIYRLLIRSEIDYGYMAENSARNRELESLQSVSNEAMKVSNGSLKSMPISSLQVITE